MPTSVYESGWKTINPAALSGSVSVGVSGSWKTVASAHIYQTAWSAWEQIYDGTIPALSSWGFLRTNDGTSCADPRAYDFSWTCNGAVNNSLHNVYIQISGLAYSVGTTVTNPQVGVVSGVSCACYPSSAGSRKTLTYTWELQLKNGTVIQSGGPTTLETTPKVFDCTV